MPAKLDIPLCRVCGGKLPPPAGRGPARRYCSARCRKAAARGRANAWRGTPIGTTDVMREAVLVAAAPAADTDEQVAAAVLECHALVGSLRRLGREARPRLACRCEQGGDALEGALAKHFPLS